MNRKGKNSLMSLRGLDSMPKEITHWTIAELIYSRMGDSWLKKALSEYKTIYFYGAVMYDSPYYAALHFGDIIKAGYRAHGEPPCDTITPYLRLGNIYDQEPHPALLALLAGALTHFSGDTTLHPLVYFLSGNKTSAHHTIETLIDRWFMEERNLFIPEKVAPLLRHLPVKEKVFYSWVLSFFNLSEDYLKDLKKTIRRHGLIQSLFHKIWIRSFLSRLSDIMGKKWQNQVSLFYPKEINTELPLFSEEIPYRHPVTGESRKTTLQKIIAESVETGLRLFNQLESTGKNGKIVPFFSSIKPRLLNTGLPPEEGSAQAYHADRDLLRNLIGSYISFS